MMIEMSAVVVETRTMMVVNDGQILLVLLRMTVAAMTVIVSCPHNKPSVDGCSMGLMVLIRNHFWKFKRVDNLSPLSKNSSR